jgi:hypothetical protein
VKDETTYGLSPERLARLLAIGMKGSDEQKKTRDGRTPGEVLQNILVSTLPFDAAMPDSLPAVLNRLCDEAPIVVGRSLTDLLLNSRTDLAVIKALKEYSKELVRRGGRESEGAAATAIYYAAIASALVLHQKKVTHLSYEELQEACRDLQQKEWIPSELKGLFRKARGACQHGRRGS